MKHDLLATLNALPIEQVTYFLMQNVIAAQMAVSSNAPKQVISSLVEHSATAFAVFVTKTGGRADFVKLDPTERPPEGDPHD